MSRTHTYRLGLEWTGNTGSGTASYRGYERTHVLRHPSKPELPGSSDAVFRGDPTRWNPEELLVASLSACHMLVYLHEAALAGPARRRAQEVLHRRLGRVPGQPPSGDRRRAGRSGPFAA
jgi:organic hydroperoxide reductase OsmC/OhrA